jgi:hypothetical protein
MVNLTVIALLTIAHWSYPGNITEHLRNHHGQNLAGLSIEQQLTLHDRIHEAERAKKPQQVQPRRFGWRFNR